MHSMSPRASSRAVTLGVAGGGVLLGHWLAYSILTSVTATHGALLTETGHAYLGAADSAGLAVVLAALAAVFLGRMTSGGDLELDLARVGVRLAGFQVAAFLAMEVAERLSAGVPVGELVHGPLLPVGVLVQVVLAALGALAIHAVCRVADRAATAFGATPSLPPAAWASLSFMPSPRPARVAVAVRSGRSPPSSR
jgi:hypothetical protein